MPLGTLLERRAHTSGDRPALRADDGDRLTFGDVADRVARVRARLAGLGLRRGDRVAIAMGNSITYPVVWLGIVTAGMVAVPVHARSGPDDAAHVLAHSGVRLVLADGGAEAAVRAAVAGSAADAPAAMPTAADVGVVPVDADGAWLPDDGPGAPPADVAVGTLASVQYTSGTTGLPKGCMLSHGYWQVIGRGMADLMHLDPDAVLLTAQPFSYVDPLWQTVAALAAGCELVVLDGFHPSTFMRSVAEHGATTFYCLAAMPRLLLEADPGDHDRAHRLRHVWCSAIPARDHAGLEARWGVPWSEVYGTTETGFAIAVPDAEHDRLVGSGSVGRLLAHCEARVVTAGGAEASDDEVGELLLRGMGFMDGYLGDPDATAAYFHDGWAHTGDLVSRDPDGLIAVHGRLGDVVRRAGENVSPAEVERAIDAHPAVLASAVVPAPDRLVREELRAVVVPRRGRHPADAAAGRRLAEDLAAHVRGRLAPFKVPRYWEVRDDLPRTPSHRVARGRIGAPVHPLIDLAADGA